MASYTNKVINALNKNIVRLEAARGDLDIVRNSVDFTRNRKLTFAQMVSSIVFMSSKSIREELLHINDFDVDTATSSAFVQARDKLHPSAFQELFKLMNNQFPCINTFMGYHLIAVDGSDLPISFDANDTETYKYNGENAKATSHFHINAAYDVLNKRYIDLIINGVNNIHEQKAMWEMAERYDGKNAIFIADRNYATWNNMEHIKKTGKQFLIRAKDIHSPSSLLKKFNLPNSEFDLDVQTTLTNRSNKEVNSNPEIYRKTSTTTTFDYLDKETCFYPISMRVVRFRINGKEEFESIVTNLPRDQFPSETIKALYNMRWDIEVSFKHLKYAAGLKAQNSKKRNNILQEIWGSAILYNLSTTITMKLSSKRAKQKRKWEYEINLTRVIHLIRNSIKRKGDLLNLPPSLEAIIIKELVPIRPTRTYPRAKGKPGYISSNYRFV